MLEKSNPLKSKNTTVTLTGKAYLYTKLLAETDMRSVSKTVSYIIEKVHDVGGIEVLDALIAEKNSS